jgi:X-X-X-Leu-X-X-Gly heptad repeat protein
VGALAVGAGALAVGAGTLSTGATEGPPSVDEHATTNEAAPTIPHDNAHTFDVLIVTSRRRPSP